jgi:hypothetical protein
VAVVADVWRNPIPLPLITGKGNVEGFGFPGQRAADLKRGVVGLVHKIKSFQGQFTGKRRKKQSEHLNEIWRFLDGYGM